MRSCSWMDESESPEFCKWANFFFAKRGMLHPEKVEEDLDSNDPLLRGSAILALQKARLPSQSTPLRLRDHSEIPLKMISEHSLTRAIATKKIELMLKSTHIDEISMALDILAEGKCQPTSKRPFRFFPMKRSLSNDLQRAAYRVSPHRAPAAMHPA